MIWHQKAINFSNKIKVDDFNKVKLFDLMLSMHKYTVMKKNDGTDMKSWSAADQATFDAADGKAEYDKCVDISTKASIREMVLPGILAISVPTLIGFAGGPEMLGGLLAGVTVSGVLMAIFQSNSGGAWDNAKKMFEDGVEIKGTMTYKGSEAHKAAVVGDTVGDPFKDTSGPSLNILVKLTSIVALVLAPFIAIDNADVNIENDETSSIEIQYEAPADKNLSSGDVINY